MKRIALSLSLLFAMACGAMAQNEAMYLYRNSSLGKLTFLKSQIDSVACSQVDLDGNRHDDYVVQEIWTRDSVYRTPIAAIDSVRFFTLTNTCPDDHHPHAVDLGLPSGTKWACCNVAAPFPEALGGYYAWGETWQKDTYSRYTYAYTEDWIDEVKIGEDIAGTSYDVAHVLMGDAWRMPTVDDIKELMDNCRQEETRRSGMEGVLVTGPNGNQIFFPLPGYRNYDEVENQGYYGFYWSSMLNTDYGYRSYYLYLGRDFWYSSDNYCSSGYSVRGVSK